MLLIVIFYYFFYSLLTLNFNAVNSWLICLCFHSEPYSLVFEHVFI